MNITNISNYELIEKKYIEEMKTQAYLLSHIKTKARIVVLENDDDNKVFSIAFRTPPEDSTGVAHIVEHTVLCGSEKYPSKDPFMELVKGSLNTFLNAMTYPDKTVYPVASYNDKDFKNLMDIYLDAVFFPNLHKEQKIFKQEGWHYELQSPEGDLTYNGVVYNEMKGVFSSPIEYLNRLTQKALFPDTAYSVESGGDPDNITDLTYEAYTAFHKRYYHPSNSYIYLYGDADMEERLAYLDKEYLSQFDYLKVDSQIEEQQAFKQQARLHDYYSVVEGAECDNKTYFSLNTVVGHAYDEEFSVAMQIIDYVICGAPGSPIRQALLDAGIGEDVSSLFEAETKQPYYTITVKNTSPDREKEFLQIVNDTLKNLVRDGLDRRSLEAAINSYEFRYREADFGSDPKGIMYGLQILDTWLYDDMKPFNLLSANHIFAFLREQMNTNYFENIIDKYLLDNSHSAIVVLEPKPGLTNVIEAKTKEKLNQIKAGMTKEQIEQCIQATNELHQYEEEESPREDVEKIPMLSREDLRKEEIPFANEEHVIDGAKTIYHDYFTNGIAYVNMAFNADKYKPYAQYIYLLSIVIGYMDTKSHTYLQLSNEIDIHTGGMMSLVSTYTQERSKDKCSIFAEFQLRVMYEKLDKGLSILREILDETLFEDEKRLKEIVSETRSRMQAKLVRSAHLSAMMRGTAHLDENSYYNEMMKGISFYRFIERLDQEFEEQKGNLISLLKGLTSLIFKKENFLGSLTCDKTGVEYFDQACAHFFEHETANSVSLEKPGIVIELPDEKKEGFITSGKVQYVARMGFHHKLTARERGNMLVLRNILNCQYLWNEVRVKGGAYGIFFNSSRIGLGYFVSYRDPKLANTNKVYEGVPDYVRQFNTDEREMTKYIIGTISALDTPLTPRTKGMRSQLAYLMDLTFEEIQEERDGVLQATPKDIAALAVEMQEILDDDVLCVIGSESLVQENKDLFEFVDTIY